jgi:hypothetical protein
MKYDVHTTSRFDKELKRLVKKYPSLRDEAIALIISLETNPLQGTDMGNGVRKIRVAVQSKGKGKKGGVRIMTCIKMVQERLYLFSIYNKGEQDNISDAEINKLIKEIE